MLDAFGRNIDYMRISVTDKCNLRCRYCMPSDIELCSMSELLSFEEIRTVVREAAALGINRIKLTGGEPLVRRGIENLVAMLAGVEGIRSLTLTTNGILLEEKLEALKQAGLTAVNISLDTLDPERFEQLTGRRMLDRVLAGIETAAGSTLPVKLNTVLRASVTDQELLELMAYAQERSLKIRFIEMMPIGAGKEAMGRSGEELLGLLCAYYGSYVKEADGRSYGNGPAVYYRFEKGAVPVGIISAVHGKFCGSCNRIRMSANGQLKSCLCYEAVSDIRGPLRRGSSEEVRELLQKTVYGKPKEHCFDRLLQITEKGKMVSIGG